MNFDHITFWVPLNCNWVVSFTYHKPRIHCIWSGLVCVAYWHLVSVRTFSVMYNHTFSKLAIHHIRHQATQNWLSAWWLHMVTLIFLGGYIVFRPPFSNVKTNGPGNQHVQIFPQWYHMRHTQWCTFHEGVVKLHTNRGTIKSITGDSHYNGLLEKSIASAKWITDHEWWKQHLQWLI